MSTLQQPVAHFLDSLAARTPTPGGGSASALGGALGLALGQMAGAYTLGNDKFKGVEEQVEALCQRLGALRQTLLGLMQQDIEAYAGYVAARNLPKNSPEEKLARSAALAQALEQSTLVPEQIAARAFDGLKLVQEMSAVANPNLAGDVAVAAYFLEAAARGAAIQVLSNCAADDTTGRNAARRQAINAQVAQCQAAREEIHRTVLKLLKLC